MWVTAGSKQCNLWDDLSRDLSLGQKDGKWRTPQLGGIKYTLIKLYICRILDITLMDVPEIIRIFKLTITLLTTENTSEIFLNIFLCFKAHLAYCQRRADTFTWAIGCVQWTVFGKVLLKSSCQSKAFLMPNPLVWPTKIYTRSFEHVVTCLMDLDMKHMQGKYFNSQGILNGWNRLSTVSRDLCNSATQA